MRTFKLLLLSLLILISLSLIFTKPGLGTLETFNNDLIKYETSKIEGREVLENLIFVKYPPSTFLILSSVLKSFPPDQEIPLFHRQNAWLIYKIILYIFYLFSWLSLLHLAKDPRKNLKMSFLDISLAYFGSVSIILPTLGLSFLDIFALPFFLLSISFLNKNKFSLAGLFYLLAVSFNWSLLALFPIYFAYCKKTKNINIFTSLSFLIIPLILIISFYARPFFFRINFLTLTSHTKLLGFTISRINNTAEIIILFLLLVTFAVSIGILLNKLFFERFLNRRKGIIFALIISVILIAASILTFNTPLPLFLLIMACVSFYLYKKVVSSTEISLPSLIIIFLGQYFSFLVFTQSSDGNLVWLTIMALVIYVLNKSTFSYFHLLLFNLLVFIKIYIFWSISGTPPVRGVYFETFQYVFTSIFILFSAYYITTFSQLKNIYKKNRAKQSAKYLKLSKYFIIILLVLLNLSLIPANGTGSDTTSWNQIAVESIRYPNLFRAHVVKEIDQLYPPLSTVVIGIFANLWKNLTGPSERYNIAVKLSIFVFYALSVWGFVKFKIKRTDSLGILNRLTVILTTFSLIIQTQGFADINIYVVPTLILSTILLFKKRYLLSGLLLGITISIKWQPIILLPLFCASIFDLKQKFSLTLRNLLVFIIGFFVSPVAVWSLVLIQPGGNYTMARSFDFIVHGAAGLSGQALNLNWIATYILHIVQPDKFYSLAELEGYNRLIPADASPKILQGYFFILSAGLILLRFWLFIKKDIYNFLKAALMIFFSHHILNKSAYEKHLFYSVLFMLLIYLVRPTKGNRRLLIMFDIMTIMNLALFFGFTGPTEINRLFLGIDITVVFSVLYVIIYFWVIKIYLSTSKLPLENRSDHEKN